MHRNCVLIIPSLNPEEGLLAYIRELTANGFSKIILINDGSSPKARTIFEAAGAMEACDLFVHTVNMGKGRALKDAFNYVLEKYPEAAGVVTADSDGQHTPEDIKRCMCALEEYPDRMILGCRQF